MLKDSRQDGRVVKYRTLFFSFSVAHEKFIFTASSSFIFLQALSLHDKCA